MARKAVAVNASYVQDARRSRLGCSRQRAVRAVRQRESAAPQGLTGRAVPVSQDARRSRLGCSRQRAVRAVRQRESAAPQGLTGRAVPVSQGTIWKVSARCADFFGSLTHEDCHSTVERHENAEALRENERLPPPHSFAPCSWRSFTNSFRRHSVSFS